MFARIVCKPLAGIDRSEYLLVLVASAAMPPRPEEPARGGRRQEGRPRQGWRGMARMRAMMVLPARRLVRARRRRTRSCGRPSRGSSLLTLLLGLLGEPRCRCRGVALALRPDFLALVLLYWCIQEPRYVGVGIAWVVGLLMDVGDATRVRPARARVRGARVRAPNISAAACCAFRCGSRRCRWRCCSCCARCSCCWCASSAARRCRGGLRRRRRSSARCCGRCVSVLLQWPQRPQRSRARERTSAADASWPPAVHVARHAATRASFGASELRNPEREVFLLPPPADARRRCSCSIAFCGLFGRFFYLQVVQHAHYQTLAETNRIAIVPIVPNRGVITDRNGIVLAQSYSAYTLEITPSRVRESRRDDRRSSPRIVDDPAARPQALQASCSTNRRTSRACRSARASPTRRSRASR